MTTWVLRLILINVAMFATQIILPQVDMFAFTPRTWWREPWTAVTYMFLHGGPGHLFFNMLGLFFFGTRVEARLGAAKFLQLYFIAGVTGALFQALLAFNAPMWGASAGVGGVLMAFAAFWPRQRIYIFGVVPVEAWLLVSIYAGYSALSGISGRTGGVAEFAHLGGYVGSYLFLLALERWSPANQFRQRVKRVDPGTEKHLKANLGKVNLDGVHAISKEEVNRILDKINAEGVGSLTAAEKLFLSNFVPPDDRKDWVQ